MVHTIWFSYFQNALYNSFLNNNNINVRPELKKKNVYEYKKVSGK